MYRIYSASKDTYITDKIINNSFRATDANVGQAGTLDLFKLYNESGLKGSATPALAKIVAFSAGSVSYVGTTLILVDSAGKTVTLTAAGANARTTEGAGTFKADAGTAATDVSANIVAAFNAVRSGDTTKIDMSAETVTGSGIVTLKQLTAGSAGNTTITGTAVDAGSIRDSNSAVVESIEFEGGADSKKAGNVELSRILLKFDYNSIADMQNSGAIDINDSSFKCILKLHDVYGGQTTPSNYDLIVMPLAQKFDEGVGYDITTYSDLDATNFVTASIQSGADVKWNQPGAMASGSLGDSNLDVFVSGTLAGPNGSEVLSLSPTQYFKEGIEDLKIDVTKIISGTITDQMSNHGLVVAFSGSYEQNEKSYFVKRFASRNSSNTAIRPKLIVQYDDSLHDNHSDMIFDVTSSLYLNNFHYGSLSNIVGGADGSKLTGNECMAVKLQTGSFKKLYSASQAMRGVNRLTGTYSASFAVSSFESTLRSHILSSGSVTFNEVWTNAAETITFLSSSITVFNNQRSGFENKHQNLLVTVTNLKDAYRVDDVINVRVFSENRERDVVFSKFPLEKKSQIFHEMYYRVRDFNSGKIVIPFDTVNKSTRLSTDKNGMYFDFYVSSLARGRLYIFDFLIRKNGFDTIVDDAASKFRVD